MQPIEAAWAVLKNDEQPLWDSERYGGGPPPALWPNKASEEEMAQWLSLSNDEKIAEMGRWQEWEDTREPTEEEIEAKYQWGFQLGDGWGPEAFPKIEEVSYSLDNPKLKAAFRAGSKAGLQAHYRREVEEEGARGDRFLGEQFDPNNPEHTGYGQGNF